MARSVAVIQADLDRLKAARASGELMVRYADKSVTYRSVAEQDTIVARLNEELDDANGDTRPNLTRRIRTRTGW